MCGVVETKTDGTEVVIANGKGESRIPNLGKNTWKKGPKTPFIYDYKVCKKN